MAQGNVENWLGKLLQMSLRSVHCVIHNAMVAIQDPNFNLLEFLNTYPAQVGYLTRIIVPVYLTLCTLYIAPV